MSRIFLLVLIFLAARLDAQLTESFSDGDFTGNPAWTGTSSWVIVTGSDVAAGATGSNTLRLSAVSGSGLQYLSTPVNGSWGTEQTWGFWMGRRGQAATAANVLYIWLYASSPDVSSASIDGYRLRFGDDASAGDKLFLERVSNGVASVILTSSGATTNGITDFGFLVRITRSAAGLWTLYTSFLPVASGMGALASDQPNAVNTTILQGSVTNNSIPNLANGYISLAALHSTAAAARSAAEFDQLIFSFAAGGALPVHFSQFRAVQSNTGIVLDWTNETENDVSGYFIERSADGQHFTVIGNTSPVKNDGGKASYTFLDNGTLLSKKYYRIRAVETSGASIYSTILRLNPTGKDKELLLFPNPVRNGPISVNINQLPPGNYTITIIHSSGQKLLSRRFIHGGGSFSTALDLSSSIKGIYILRIEGPVPWNKSFVVQ